MNSRIVGKLDNFFKQFTFHSYKKGDVILRAGDTPSDIFYLKKGNVKQYSLSKDGDEQVLTIYKPPSFFPLMFAINNTKNTYFFEATTAMELWKAPAEEVLTFLNKNPDVMYDLIGRLYQGMHGLLTRIEFLMFGNAYAKVIFTLINLSARFGEEREIQKGIYLRIAHKDIASYSGLRKETISREVSKLQKKNIVENKNHLIIIKDIEKLKTELGIVDADHREK